MSEIRCEVEIKGVGRRDGMDSGGRNDGFRERKHKILRKIDFATPQK